jgi:transcription antitermination factor NusG
VTAVSVSPKRDEIMVGLSNGHVNIHDFPSGELLTAVQKVTKQQQSFTQYIYISMNMNKTKTKVLSKQWYLVSLLLK